MTAVIAKLSTLGPEIAMLIGACLCLFLGLARGQTLRRTTGGVALVAIMVAGWLACRDAVGAGELATYIKLTVCAVGGLLLLLALAVPGKLEFAQAVSQQTSPLEASGPEYAERGEFFGFFLLSLAGVMLCAGASDLVWLFLALELTSLPTYVMVATARERVTAQESGVKYFFLGAMAAAVFLYGFTLLFGAAGSTEFSQIQRVIAQQGLTPLMTLGLVLSVLGISFKIAAVPMHFYAADVYQGATTSVTAFLAFVPKTAGFVSIILLLQLIGWPLPPALTWMLWIMAAATMTLGNVLGLLQTSVKRVLAYSSIAHSGYMLVGLLGNDNASADGTLGNGVAAVLFYLPAYGLATLAAFGVLACLERQGEEAETFDDLAGLSHRSPMLATVLLISVLSLIGLPPMVGFLGKIYLFGSAIEHGYIGLVVIAVLNSAVSAVYYLRMVGAVFFSEPQTQTYLVDSPLRRLGVTVAALGAIYLGLGGNTLVNAAREASRRPASPGSMLVQQPEQPGRDG